MTTTIKIGTRRSKLALWQSHYIADQLRAAHADLVIELVHISTKGDRVLDTPLPLIGGKGLFTAELEAALRAGTIDCAVHSLKDLPTDDPQGLVIGAIPKRVSPQDTLISRAGYTLDTLPQGATIGTSSTRRAAQIKGYRPDLHTRDIRGNVDTRINKAYDDNFGYDAILLAHAGLIRLGLDDVITQIIPFDVMLPAAGQGALAVQCRDDQPSRTLFAPLHEAVTATCVRAERAFLAGLGGGCSVPIAAYAHALEDGTFQLRGRICATDGSDQIDLQTTFDPVEDAQSVGYALAQAALSQGAKALLERGT